MFWTDAVQAQERLGNCFVCYDKKPVYIERVEEQTKGKPYALTYSRRNEEYKRIPLDDEKWNNFRDLPTLGWFNHLTGAGNVQPYFLERRAVNTRNHGINTGNTRIHAVTREGVKSMDRQFNLGDFFENPGYLETANDETAYPKLSEILMSLDENPGGVAFSRKLCVMVTEEGMKWLLRKGRRIGFFTGTDSLNLFPKLGFYKEELMSCPTFDINNIKEF